MEAVTHKCPNCGGALLFHPEDQKFHCPYCLSVFTEEEVLAFEKKEAAAKVADPFAASNSSLTENVEQSDPLTKEQELPQSDLELYLCPNCGAEIVTDPTTAATFCYFCHNPVALTARLSGKFQPEKVLPFAIPKERAIHTFLEWTKKKWFIPKNFFSEEQIQLLTGVYFPYWQINADMEGSFRGKGTTLRVWRVGELEYTETKQFAIYRKGHLSFSHLIKNALSKNVQKNMVTSVQPFTLEKAIPFHTQYLAGFQAEKRDIEYNTLQPEVQQELKEYTAELLKSTANRYNTVITEQIDANIESLDNHYILLPVWLLTYKNKGSDKVYYYAMNGETGKVAGVLPLDYLKLAFVTGGLFFALLLLFLLGGYFL